MSKNLFGQRPLKEVVRSVLDAAGKRATHDELVDGTTNQMTKGEYDLWERQAFRSAVIAAAKGGAGVEKVRSTGDGEVAAVQQLSFEEIEAAARRNARLGGSNLAEVRRLAELCEQLHGKSFDPERIIAEEAA